MDDKRVAEVERLMLDAWRETLAEPDDAGANKKKKRRGGEEQLRGERLVHRVVPSALTEAELWEWLYAAPSPHGCLSFLDVVDNNEGEGRHKKQEEEEKAKEDKQSDNEEESKKAILACARFAVATTPPAMCDLVLMHKRLQRASEMMKSDDAFWLVRDMLDNVMRGVVRQNCEAALSTTLGLNDNRILSDVLRKLLDSARIITTEATNKILVEKLLTHPDEELRLLAIDVLSHGAQSSGSREAIMKWFLPVVESDPSSAVRERAINRLGETVNEPHEEVLRLALLAMEDEDSSVVTASIQLINTMVEEHINHTNLQSILPQLLGILTRAIVWKTEIKSLVDLTVECVIKNIKTCKPFLPHLPLELQSLVSNQLQKVEDNDEDEGGFELRRQAACLIEELCRSQIRGFDQLLSIAKERLSHDVSWQLRESGVFILGIMGESEEASAVQSAWSCVEFVFECISAPEVKVRAMSYWSLATILKAHAAASPNELHEVEQTKRFIEGLVERMLVETHPPSLVANLSAMATLMPVFEAATSSSDSLNVRVLDNCMEMYARFSMASSTSNENIIESLYGLIAAWFEQASLPELACHGLARVVSETIEKLAPNTQPTACYHSIIFWINRIVSAAGKVFGDEFQPYAERICTVLMREIRWLCSLIGQSEMDTSEELNLNHQSLSECFSAMSRLVEHKVSVPPQEMMEMIYGVLKMEREQDQAFNLLGSLARWAPEVLMASGAEIKNDILRVLCDTIGRKVMSVAITDDRDLWALGKIALHAPFMLSDQWVTAFTEQLRADDFPFMPLYYKRTVVQVVLQLGRHFVSSIAQGIAMRALTVDSMEWYFDSGQEKADEVVGWTNLMRRLVFDSPTWIEAMEPVEFALKSSIGLVDMMVNSEPRFRLASLGQQDDDDDEDDDHEEDEAFDEPSRQAVQSLLQDVLSHDVVKEWSRSCLALPLSDALPQHAYLSWFHDNERRENVVQAVEGVLSPEHDLVRSLRMAYPRE